MHQTFAGEKMNFSSSGARPLLLAYQGFVADTSLTLQQSIPHSPTGFSLHCNLPNLHIQTLLTLTLGHPGYLT